MTTEEWKDVIDQTGRLSLITFTGGEPMVRDDCMELIAYASAKRRTHLITNGTRLTESCAKGLVELAPRSTLGRGFQFAGVSLEGPRDVHDRIVRKKGAFDTALNGIAALSRYRRELGKSRPLIHVSTVIQQENLEHLPEMAEITAEAGAEVLNLELEVRFLDLAGIREVRPYTLDASQVELPRLDRQALLQALEATHDAAARAGIELRLPRMSIEDILQYHDGGLSMDEFQCRIAWTTLNIDAQGGVYPCFIYKVGDLREQRLKAIWNGPEMRACRMRLQKAPFAICQGCCHLHRSARSSQPVPCKAKGVDR